MTARDEDLGRDHPDSPRQRALSFGTSYARRLFDAWFGNRFTAVDVTEERLAELLASAYRAGHADGGSAIGGVARCPVQTPGGWCELVAGHRGLCQPAAHARAPRG